MEIYIPLIINIVWSITVVLVTRLIAPHIEKMITIYREIKLPKQVDINENLQIELAEIKTKMSNIEIAKGFSRRGN